MAVVPTHSRLAAFSAGGLGVEVHLWDIPYLVPFRIARPDPNEESSRTAFVHPFTQERIEVEAPVPDDMRGLMALCGLGWI